jgi:UDP-D-galactose:(glucosyl)LPS alpha-1,6-D-galactosyltransferase
VLIDIVLGRALGRGGLETVLSLVCNELQRRGHQVRLFQFQPPVHEEWLNTLPNMYYYDPVLMGYSESYQGEIPIFRQSLGYRRLLREMGVPDVVLATHTPYFSLLTRMAVAHLAEQRPPIISWIHGPVEAYGDGAPLRFADAHLAISQQVRRSLQNTLTSKAPIYYVGNPVATAGIEPVKRPESGVVLLYVGRLENAIKRVDVLLRALRAVGSFCSLVVVGDGPDREELASLAHELGIMQRVRWLGWRRDPWAAVDEASLLVLPSEYEGFGVVVLEALARGLPVIVSKSSGAAEVVQERENGWTLETGDEAALATLLSEIIKGQIPLPSPERCMKSVDPYKVDKVVTRIECALQQVRALYNPALPMLARPAWRTGSGTVQTLCEQGENYHAIESLCNCTQ